MIKRTKLSNGGTCFEYVNGSKFWYLNNQLHREDGPAVELIDGTKYWYSHDKKHREDGHAFEGNNGVKEYWLNNKIISKEKFEQLIKLKAFW